MIFPNSWEFRRDMLRSIIAVTFVCLLAGCDKPNSQRPKDETLVDHNANQPATEVPEPEPELESFMIPNLNMKMIPIKPGRFLMGAKIWIPGSEPLDETPAHHVTLTRAFWIGQTEVTHGQWKAVMGTSILDQKTRINPNLKKKFYRDREKRAPDNHPMCYVSWNETVEFCNKLTLRERRSGRLPRDEEYRLPTEAEWEYSCRAGSQKVFSFGSKYSQLGDYEWHHDNSASQTSANPVARKKPNAWGLYDMQGNVREWCSDWFSRYPHDDPFSKYKVIDPTGPKESTRAGRVVRGGSFTDYADDCRSSRRGAHGPTWQYATIGFRIVRALRTPAKERLR